MTRATIMWYGGMRAAIYNEDVHSDMLYRFFKKTDVDNNKDMDALAINARNDSLLTLIIVNDEIINLSLSQNTDQIIIEV